MYTHSASTHMNEHAYAYSLYLFTPIILFHFSHSTLHILIRNVSLIALKQNSFAETLQWFLISLWGRLSQWPTRLRSTSALTTLHPLSPVLFLSLILACFVFLKHPRLVLVSESLLWTLKIFFSVLGICSNITFLVKMSLTN